MAEDAAPRDDAGEPACDGTDTESCERDSRCIAEHAYRADMPGNGTQFAACVPIAMVCNDGGAELTCGEAPDGTLFVFPSTCLPQGFEERPDTACDEAGLPSQCEDLEPEACEESAVCRTIDGRVRGSDDPLAPSGCIGADTGCGDAETCAFDGTETGDPYWFPSTCIPAGWVPAPCTTGE
jgi:hypothetical protein